MSPTIDSIRTELLAKKRSAEEIAREALKFAEAENPKTNAYLTFAPGTGAGSGAGRGSEDRRG